MTAPPPEAVPISYEKPQRTYNDDKPEELFEELRAKKIEDEAFENKVRLNKQETLRKRLKA